MGKAAEQSQVGAALEGLVVVMEDVSDPRGRQGRRHLLPSVLSIAVLGCLCGCDDAEALQDWAEKEEDWLADFIALPWGIPSQDTFLRVLAMIDPTEFRWAFARWVGKAFPKAAQAAQIAIDGKTARRSGDKAAESSAVHMVSALACETRVVLAQQATKAKSNELVAIRELLSLIELRSALVSIDALGCQSDIAQRITQRGGDYLLALKDNQPTLCSQVGAAFDALALPATRNVDRLGPPASESFVTTCAGHGRIERRTATVIHDFADWVEPREEWSTLRTLVRVESEVEHEGTGKTTSDARYTICSRHLSAEEAAGHVRNHWGIENGLHYVLDVTFGEDSYMARKRNAAANFIVIRHFAVNLIRSYTGDRLSVPRRRRLCDYRPEYRAQLLAATAL